MPARRQENIMKKPINLGLVVCVSGILFLIGCSRSNEKPAAPPQPPVDFGTVKTKAEQGDLESQVRLGQLYANGEGVKRDFAEAARWYKQAADKGYPDAQTALGELYEAGRGVALDYVQAAKLYRLAADQGNIIAQFSLASMLQAGRGIQKDHAEAFKWFRAAAERGDSQAQFNVAQRYEIGIGVPEDRVEAFKWFSLAAGQGITDARARREKLKEKMSGEELKEAKKRIASFVPHVEQRKGAGK